MTAPVRIEAEAWSDLRFATLARLMGLADLEHALIRTAKIWSWQTEHYTPDEPTYVVDADLIDSALGPGGASAMVRSRLAAEEPGGFRIRGSKGRIEWLWQRRVASARGGEARKRSAHNQTKPSGYPTGMPAPEPRPEPKPSPLVPAPDPKIPDLTPSRAIVPTPAPPPMIPALATARPGPRGEAPMLWRELEQARTEAGAVLGVSVLPLPVGDRGERDLAEMFAAARERGPAEVETLVRQGRHAIAMAKAETISGEKPPEWFTGAVFGGNNFRRLVAKQPRRPAPAPAAKLRKKSPALPPDRERSAEEIAELSAMANHVASLPTAELVKRFGETNGEARAPPASSSPTPDQQPTPAKAAT